MATTIPPRGLIVDLITPLKADGTIDGRGLSRIIERIMPHARAIFLCSPVAGEGKNLNPAQRLDLLRKTLVVARNRLPLLVWVTQATKDKTLETLETLKRGLDKWGQDSEVHWVDAPLYYHSNRGLPPYYADLCQSTPQSFILYNDPLIVKHLRKPLKRANIRTAILKELSLLPCIQGLIFLGSMGRVYNYQRACRRRAGFRIYDGDETHFLEHPSTSGVVSMGSNLSPDIWEKVTRFSIEVGRDQEYYPDQLQQIWEAGEYLSTLREFYRPSPPAIIKGLLSDMGIIESATCLSGESVDEKTIGRMRELMERYSDRL